MQAVGHSMGHVRSAADMSLRQIGQHSSAESSVLLLAATVELMVIGKAYENENLSLLSIRLLEGKQ